VGICYRMPRNAIESGIDEGVREHGTSAIRTTNQNTFPRWDASCLTPFTPMRTSSNLFIVRPFEREG
jgi:hypothetical protein